MSTVDNSVMYDATQASTRASGAAGASGAVASQRVAAQPTAAMRSLTVLPRVQIAGDQAHIVTPRKPRYERVKQLGEGAFGEVELAVDNDIERTVAIKRIKANVLDEDSVLRFVSEVQSVGRLEHPGIVPIHDVGCDDQGYFFVMKYVECETLESIIAKLRAGDVSYRSRYSMEARAALMLSLCRAVQFAHTRGYVHRDIKPANIMVGAFGEVVLMDWGLAKDPAQRYQSLGELIARIEAALNGDAPVQCPCTGLKRANGQWSDFIDHHPNLAVTAAVFGLYFVIAGIASTLWFAVR